MILAWRGSKIRGRGQARLEEPRAGQEFLSAKRFLVFYGHYMAFPGISVASGHVPVAKYFSAIHHVSAYPISSCNGVFNAKPRRNTANIV